MYCGDGGEDIQILVYLMNHWCSVEGCRVGLVWGPISMGCAYVYQYDGRVEPKLMI